MDLKVLRMFMDVHSPHPTSYGQWGFGVLLLIKSEFLFGFVNVTFNYFYLLFIKFLINNTKLVVSVNSKYNIYMFTILKE